MQFTVDSIGTVSSPVVQQTDLDWGEVESTIVVESPYRLGLEGLDQFSHVIVVTFLHEADFISTKHLQRKPQGLDEMPEVGIFSQRAKHRPNPIGITAVKVLEVLESGIRVQGLDAINGTPVLDIKPYYPHYDRVDGATVPSWVEELMRDYF